MQLRSNFILRLVWGPHVAEVEKKEVLDPTFWSFPHEEKDILSNELSEISEGCAFFSLSLPPIVILSVCLCVIEAF